MPVTTVHYTKLMKDATNSDPTDAQLTASVMDIGHAQSSVIAKALVVMITGVEHGTNQLRKGMPTGNTTGMRVILAHVPPIATATEIGSAPTKSALELQDLKPYGGMLLEQWCSTSSRGRSCLK